MVHEGMNWIEFVLTAAGAEQVHGAPAFAAMRARLAALAADAPRATCVLVGERPWYAAVPRDQSRAPRTAD